MSRYCLHHIHFLAAINCLVPVTQKLYNFWGKKEKARTNGVSFLSGDIQVSCPNFLSMSLFKLLNTIR